MCFLCESLLIFHLHTAQCRLQDLLNHVVGMQEIGVRTLLVTKGTVDVYNAKVAGGNLYLSDSVRNMWPFLWLISFLFLPCFFGRESIVFGPGDFIAVPNRTSLQSLEICRIEYIL